MFNQIGNRSDARARGQEEVAVARAALHRRHPLADEAGQASMLGLLMIAVYFASADPQWPGTAAMRCAVLVDGVLAAAEAAGCDPRTTRLLRQQWADPLGSHALGAAVMQYVSAVAFDAACRPLLEPGFAVMDAPLQ